MATERIDTFDDLVSVLDRNPDYQRRLRQRFLDEEFLQLPAQTRALTERVNAHTEQIRALTERVNANTEQIRANTEQIQALTEQVKELVQQMKAVAAQLGRHDNRLGRLGQRTDYLMGSDAEWRFRRNAGAYFGDILRRIRVIDNNDLAIQVDDAIVAGAFQRADRRFVLALDLALRGRDWDTNEKKCLAVEVSVGLGQSDVERAKSRAMLLEKLLGIPAIPVVAGYSIAPEFQQLADGQGVQVVITEEPV